MSSCLYFAETQDATEYLPLTETLRVRIAIVGGGFTGLSTALHLKEAGEDVAVIEAKVPGWGASGRNGGQVNPGLKREPADVLDAFGPERGERLIRLSGEAPDYVFDLVRRHGIDCDATQAGSIRVVRTSAEIPLIEGSIKAWTERGAALEFLNRTALQQLIGTNAYPSGLLDRRGGSLNPLAYAQGLAKAVTRLGGKIFSRTPVTALDPHGERWILRTPHGTIEADRVVLATNGYTDRLWPGLRLTVVPVFSAIAATAPLPAPLLSKILPGRQVVYENSWRVLYFRIDTQGRLLMGGPCTQRECHGPGSYRHLIAHAERMFPELKGVAWRHFWNGQVAVTMDHYPHLHEPAPGIVAALGYSGRGIAMTTAMGRIVSRRMLGATPETLELPISAFQRFPFHRFWRPIVEAAQVKYAIMDKLRRIA